MPEILRVKLKWSGFNGAPGYSIFHFRDFEAAGAQSGYAQDACVRVQAFANGIKGLIPYGTTLAVEPDVELLEDSTGEMINVVSTTPTATVTSIATSGMGYAGAVGAVVTWRTQGVRNGRRVRGRTFLVPIVAAAFNSSGQFSAENYSQLVNTANSLASTGSTPDLGVYARPSAKGATDGAWHKVSSASVPNMGAVLRSRRD